MLMHRQEVVFLFLLAFCYFEAFGSGATLPIEEEDALKQISKTLGKENWNFSADPCIREWSWADPSTTKLYENNVTCNCSFQNNTVCHVVSIVLKGQNLQGELPAELVKLPYLQQIDLTRNYLNGTIPAAWGSMQLVKISLLGNRLTGPIPVELWNISTLKYLILEANLFSGPLSPKIGNLVNIDEIQISSNAFSGELPTSLGNLSSLKDFRISDSNFTGKIPDFIQKWTELDKLTVQGSGLRGPIPPGISSLVKLTDLRISDINGTASGFPPLRNMKSMRTLILRNCNLTGPIPDYIWTMKDLKNLDLSFNMLEGQFPPTINKPKDAKYIYLTSNLLNGTVPEGLLKKGDKNWAFSTTGNFLDNDIEEDTFIAENVSRLIMPDFDLYTTARLSPLSLTYYGLCLWNGNYTVKLHFAEIVFTDDRTYSSLGKRIFDVYIQGKLVLKDFNIEDEAGGTHRAVVKNFTAIVATNTLEIRFYWAGKGTQSIPYRGTYGPLISAISVDPDFTPPGGGNKISAGAVIGIAYVLQERGSLLELVDPKLGSEFNKEEAIGMINIALLCTSTSSPLRPTMSSVVSMLEGRTVVQSHISEPNLSTNYWNNKSIRSRHQRLHSQEQSQSNSMDGPQTGASTSASDLYPIIMDLDFLNHRE
ncbi:putative leucine-rich repeat receptor-like serine/threonine-protein kinase isoform X1 [Cinnamomum micranthum f. kanehirae]|uniref:non-specific serine/threonine protein kinase n=1 Tax=Cinnamomum micranthum f. kanehirae TaxID=337451 RepID=A0A3S3NXB4_9MAGN|nr:putative leucine-rich repeat receptor-like serine/threonine-protein kinase isoform X1 [Cinnamomum micranthum f. kanehirae]